MICPICGTDLGDSAFCDKCGTIVNAETGMESETSDVAENTDKPAGKRTAAIAVVAIVAVIVIAAFVMWPKGDGVDQGASGQESTATQETPSSQEAASQPSSAAQSPSAAPSEQSASRSSSSSASVSSSSKTLNPADFDENQNPTLHAIVEHDGEQLQSLLQQNGFIWYDQASSWIAKDGRLLSVLEAQSNMSARDIDRLGTGGVDSAVIYMVAASGYSTPRDAFNALAAKVVVENDFENEEALFAIVSNTNNDSYLAVITTTNSNEQTVLLYTEEAVEQGLFRDTIGVDAGSTLADTWKTITR